MCDVFDIKSLILIMSYTTWCKLNISEEETVKFLEEVARKLWQNIIERFFKWIVIFMIIIRGTDTNSTWLFIVGVFLLIDQIHQALTAPAKSKEGDIQ